MASYILKRKTFGINPMPNFRAGGAMNIAKGVAKVGAIGVGTVGLAGAGAAAYGMHKAGETVDAVNQSIPTVLDNITSPVK